MTTIGKNDILPATFEGLYFQSSMADSGETFFFDFNVPTVPDTYAVHFHCPSSGGDVD